MNPDNLAIYLGVVLMMDVTVIHRYDASRAGNRATHMLELHRRMVNMKAVVQYVIDAMQYVIAPRRRHILDQDMTTQSV